MVSATFAEKGLPPPKEEVHWRVLSVVGFAVVRGGLSSLGNTPRSDAIVRVVADHDGVVLGRPSRGAVVGVAADLDGAVPRCPGGGATVTDMVLDIADDGAFEDLAER